MSSNLGVGKTLELLERLKGTVRDFAARAEKLNADYHTRTDRERRLRETARQKQAQELAAANSQADAAFAAESRALQARHEARKTRIGAAYQASKEQRLADIDTRTGTRKYELQKTMLQAERDRDAGLAAAGAAVEEFRSNLAAEQAALAAQETAAQKAFKGYRKLVRLLAGAGQKAPAPGAAPDEHQLLAELRERLAKTQDDLRRFGGFRPLRLFKHLPVWVLIVLGSIPLLLRQFGSDSAAYWKAGLCAAGGVAVILIARGMAQHRARRVAASIADGLAQARRLHDTAAERAEAHYQQELGRIGGEFESATQTVDQRLKQALAEAGERRVACRMGSDDKASRALAKNDQLHRARQERLQRQQAESRERLGRAVATRSQAETEASEKREAGLNANYQAEWQKLAEEWKSATGPIYERIQSANALAEKLFPPWQAPVLEAWKPPARFAAAAKFGRMDVEVEKLAQITLKDGRLVLPGPARFSLPACLAYPEQGSILFETADQGHEEAIGALNNLMLRLLATAPPGRLNFTILDPVGLGQNFAGIMHLADHEAQLINNRIWTQSGQIEQKLADLNEHMEKVIQMYLRNEYATIAEYNEQAGVIAEKYHLLVIADFPVNFTETAAKRLLSIAASGARCGVYMLIHWDQRLALPPEFIPDELRASSVCLSARGKQFLLGGKAIPGADLVLDAPPPPEFAIEFVNKVGLSSRDSSRVEVPFAHVAPPEAEIWSQDTAKELLVPIGRTGATKFQYLAIGKGTCQHALIAGKTGSGKSTLFHVVITNLALWCSPEQVEFYLVDFKKGVEFKCYATHRLPHARVVAIESDREFGLSVLQRVDDELKRRGDLFRQLGVQDVAGYKRAGGAEPIPRSLLIIDEFQEFFVEDDRISQTASLLLDRLVRQGRAFGIHVLLGSQTLGGAYTVARTTLGQMVIRIALQCNEADAYLIMDENNPAPRLLSRPGEGIYNDMAGMIEGNSPFQVVWLPDQVREANLAKVRARANEEEGRRQKAEGIKTGAEGGPVYPGPIVFEGNAPADVRENALLLRLLEAPALTTAAAAGRIWLGAPNSIKGPTEAVFQRQSGSNLLLVGQRDETLLGLLSIGLVSLAGQYPLGTARFILCDGTAPGTSQRQHMEQVVRAIPHPLTQARAGDLGEVIRDLAAEMKQRAEAADSEAAPPVFLFIHGLQKYGKLRYEEDFGFSSGDAEAEANPAVLLNNIICEGTRLGCHVIATCDTYNNVNRYLSRKAFSEFEMRVLFQMSANDSASLIDSPKASLLGLHRALFFNAQEGYLETFRPYALPGSEWLEQAARNLARLLKQENRAATAGTE
ncbi:MAG TPA: FtsK/SpoIIIE domain-containing protein [Verrucomicrobiota bacterium]|nr:FtsK/SpoIIIE domain-containing protein [Verrucomicrobiota bacterium]HQL77416.1 FtsK/SpoIIIE domain-containing protein [Verrucomicrobiota bacterium]